MQCWFGQNLAEYVCQGKRSFAKSVACLGVECGFVTIEGERMAGGC